MPLIEVFGGYLRELFAIGNDITLRIDEFIKFPVGASSVEQFACFTEMFPIESCLFACPVEPREFSLKFSTMSTMEKFAQVFNFTSKLRRKLGMQEGGPEGRSFVSESGIGGILTHRGEIKKMPRPYSTKMLNTLSNLRRGGPLCAFRGASKSSLDFKESGAC
jgi:hypothetical protein